MDLERFIYDFNLFSTETVKDVQQGCLIINNGRKREIDYGNCVSMYDIADRFNKSYLDFLKDSCQLKEIIEQLGEEVSYISHIASDNFTSLCLDVSKPYSDVFDEKYAIVYFFNNNGNCFVSSNNGINRFDENYKARQVEFDEASIGECLDIVKKNGLFLDAYKDLRTKFVFGNGTNVIFSKIDGKLLDELTTFTLTFGNSYMNKEDIIEVKFRLGDNFGIIYDESKVIIGDEEITDSKKKHQIINELLSSIYVNADRLSGLYQSHDEKKVFLKEEK